MIYVCHCHSVVYDYCVVDQVVMNSYDVGRLGDEMMIVAKEKSLSVVYLALEQRGSGAKGAVKITRKTRYSLRELVVK